MEIVSIILAILIFLLIGAIGLLTDILHESVGDKNPYSFRKFQLWLWTLVICPAFVLHWGFSSSHAIDLNQTCLILLGISMATTLTAEIVSNAQVAARENKIQTLSAGENLVMLKRYLDTKSFWIDIISDNNGQLSISRLQQLVFTLSYLVIFVAHFFSKHFTYPEFENTAFILMGISTATYLVGKGLNK